MVGGTDEEDVITPRSRLFSGSRYQTRQSVEDQDVKTKTKIKGDDAQAVTYTGCVADGPQTRTFVLNKVMPVGQTTETTTNASGVWSTTTTTTSALVQRCRADHRVLRPQGASHRHVGSQGDMTSEDRDEGRGRDGQRKEETKTESDLPQFRVISIRNLGETCQ